ncbi:MAG: acyl carrier protein [Opitutales bacterium]|nr:acyl carrier protein [Opitutales bacterium]
MDENLKKLQNIFRDILDDENLEITESFSQKDCEGWDSVAMVQIILAVESEFGVKFTTSEVANTRSVSDLLKKIS